MAENELFSTTSAPQVTAQNQDQGLLQPQATAAAPTYQAPTTDVGGTQYTNTAPEETVESRLNNLLTKDNPYLASARQSATRQAASRGLQNTSIAAGAGEEAAIKSALPIAQQDAGFYQQKHLAGHQGEIESALSSQVAQQQAGLYGVQGSISSQLSAQDYQQKAALQQAEQQADIAWKKIDLEARMQVEYDRLTEENRARFDTTVNSINEQYQKDYLEIMLNPNFKTAGDRQAALDALNTATAQRVQIAASIAGVELSWEPPAQQASSPSSGIRLPDGTTVYGAPSYKPLHKPSHDPGWVHPGYAY